jgi:hypothetical protein
MCNPKQRRPVASFGPLRRLHPGYWTDGGIGTGEPPIPAGGIGTGDPPIPSAAGGIGTGEPPIAVGGMGTGDPPIAAALRRAERPPNTTDTASAKAKA